MGKGGAVGQSRFATTYVVSQCWSLCHAHRIQVARALFMQGFISFNPQVRDSDNFSTMYPGSTNNEILPGIVLLNWCFINLCIFALNVK